MKRLLLGIFILSLPLYSMGIEDQSIESISKIYSQVQEVSYRIVKECDPANCLLIGLGRSPSMFIDYFDKHLPGYSKQIPLSQLQTALYDDNDEKIKILIEYLKNQMPDDLSKYKKVSIFDYTVSGDSIFFGVKLFNDALNELGFMGEVNAIQLTWSLNGTSLTERSDMMFDTSGIKRTILKYHFRDMRELSSALWNSDFESVSKVPELPYFFVTKNQNVNYKSSLKRERYLKLLKIVDDQFFDKKNLLKSIPLKTGRCSEVLNKLL